MKSLFLKIVSLKLIFCFLYFNVAAQLVSNDTYISKGSLAKEKGIVLRVQMLQNPCTNSTGTKPQKTFFRLQMSGIKQKYFRPGVKSTLVLRLRIEDCLGVIKWVSYTVDLARYNADGINRNDREWFFEGNRLITFDGEIRQVGTSVNSVCESILPSSLVVSASQIRPGESVTISVSNDGKLCTNANWSWYAEGCGDESNFIESNRSGKIIVSPKKNTTYYLRINTDEGNFCISKTIYVNQDLRPIKVTNTNRSSIVISGAPVNPICKGERLNLIVSDGNDANKKNWVWRKNSCDGEIIATGRTLTYVPEEAISLFVQADSEEQKEKCHEVKIDIKKPKELPLLSINNDAKVISICEGELTKLEANGDKTGITRINWYREKVDSTPIATQSFYSFTGNSTTTYLMQGEGECGARTNLSSIKIVVRKRSFPPDEIIAERLTGKSIKLSAKGGYLEENSFWSWYKGDNCSESNSIERAISINYNASKGSSISIRAEGGECGISMCKTYKIETIKKEEKYTFFNLGVIDFTHQNFSLTAGGNNFYLRYKFGLKNVQHNYEIIAEQIPNYPIHVTDYYQFNGQLQIKRTGFSGGAILGRKLFKMYLGAGWGLASPLWGVDVISYSNTSSKIERWGKVMEETRDGLEAEAGFFLKLGKKKSQLNLMGGLSVIFDNTYRQYVDGNIGIGFTF